jgi:hypothetical protein
MKTTSKVFLLLLLALIAAVSHGQIPLRQINSTTTISKLFAVPTTTNIEEEVTTYDLARMIWEDKIQMTRMVIDHNRKLTITTLFPQTPRYEGDYEYNTGSSVTNEYGTTLYGHDGDFLDSVRHRAPHPGFSFHSDSVAMFGMNNLFDQSPAVIEELYKSAGFTVAITGEDNVLSAINDSIEIYINPAKLIFETRFFQDDMLIYSDWKKYQRIKDVTIPMVMVFTQFESMVNGTRFQVSEITRYTSYTILGAAGDTVVNFYSEPHVFQRKEEVKIARFNEMSKQIAEIRVYPNPASGQLTVDVPLFVANHVDVHIMNAQGVLVYQNQGVETGSIISIDISSLAPGIYLIRCGKGEKWQTTRFVKQ